MHEGAAPVSPFDTLQAGAALRMLGLAAVPMSAWVGARGAGW